MNLFVIERVHSRYHWIDEYLRVEREREKWRVVGPADPEQLVEFMWTDLVWFLKAISQASGDWL